MMNSAPSPFAQRLRIQIVLLALVGLLLIGLTQINLLLALAVLLAGAAALIIAAPRLTVRPLQASLRAEIPQAPSGDNNTSSSFRSSKVNFRHLVETASEGVLVIDADNIITFANKQIAAMLAYGENELINQNILTLFADEAQQMQNTPSSSPGSEELNDYNLRRKDGSTLWAIISTTPLVEDGTYSGVLMMITDITERKQAEAALRQNQQFVERMTQTLPDIVFIYDLHELRPTYQNRPLAEQLGYSDEEIAAMGPNHEWGILTHPDDQTQLGQLVMKVVQAAPGDVVEMVFRMKHKNGNWHWINIREILFEKGPDGLPRQLLGLARDVTDRIQTQEQQHENEKRYKALWAESQRQAQELRLLDEVRTLLSREQDIPAMIGSVVTQIAESFGYPLVCLYLLEGETLRLQVEAGLAGAEPAIPITAGVTGRVARTGETVYLPDVRTDPDFVSNISSVTSGIYAPLMVNQHVIGTLNVESTEEFPLTPDDVRLINSLGQHISIALSQARLYTSLRESEERFRQIADNISQAFWVRDVAERRLLYISPAFETIWKRPSASVLQDANAFLDAVHPADLRRVQARQANQAGKVVFDEYRIIWPDGTVRWLTVRIYPVFDANGKLYREVGLAEDVTDRRAAETLVRRQRDYLDALHQTTLDLMSRLDLTTLLNDILSRAGNLLGTKHGYICLRNDEHQVIEAVATQGVFPPKFRLQFGEGISGRVWQSSQPIWVSGYSHQDDKLPDLGTESPHAIAGVPLKSGNEVVGVICLGFADEDRPFREEDLDLLSRFANLASIALENAQLYALLEDQLIEIHQTQEALQEIQSQQKAILDNIPDIAWLKDEAGAYIAVNEAFALACGRPVAAIIGKTDFDIWPPEYAMRYWEEDQHVMKTGTRELIEGTSLYSDGRLHEVEVFKTPLYDINGQVAGIIGISHDMTERKLVEEQLRDYAMEVERLYHDAPCGYHSLNDEGVFIRINDTELAWFGYSREEVVGKMKLTDILTASSQQSFRNEFRQFKQNGSVEGIEYEVVRKDGSSIHVLLNAAAERDASGRFLYSRASMFDITERKRIEAAEQEQRALAEALRDTAAALSSTLDLDKVLDHVLDNVSRVVPHEAANVVLLQEGKLRMMRYRGYKQVEVNALREFSRRVADEIPTFRQIMETHKPLIVNNVETAPIWTKNLSFAHIQSFLGVPIILNNEVIGFINVDSYQAGFFTPTHAERLLSFANQAAVAIQNARLFRQAQELATVEERQRLARELHDAVSQMLFSASLVAETLPRLWERYPGEVKSGLAELQRLTRGALAEMRNLLLELRPHALLETEMSILLKHLVDAVTGHTQVPVTLDVTGQRILPPDVQLTFYRVAQESLNNIVKHARATKITVQLKNLPASTTLRIQDNGRGFDPQKVLSGHLGLVIMQERATDAGATLSVHSEPGKGTEIILTWGEVDQ
jgi:two-component system nitrate/nitrite sensor histidine kinase NarX